MTEIDLNCDMGEAADGSVESDVALMDFVSSVNIACGYHAGTEAMMRALVGEAKKRKKAIGAHPSLRDREGFGRRVLEVTPAEVFAAVTEQIKILRRIAEAQGTELHHVKPHGALYNMAARDRALADAIADGVFQQGPGLLLVGLSGSELIGRAAAKGLRTAAEVFCDRRYEADGSLVDRSKPRALIEDRAEAVGQVLEMLHFQRVTSVDGIEVPVEAQTVCIHGDGPNALEFASSVHHALLKERIKIRAVT